MDDYSMLRIKYNIPKSHTLQCVNSKEKDRATFSEKITEILEYDKNNNQISQYIIREYVDAFGIKEIYEHINLKERK